LNLSKAFDTIYHIILLNNFNKLYIKGMVNNLISLYLKNKKHVRINVELSVHQITTQYPTLFNLYYKIKPRFFVTHTNLRRSTYSHQTFNCYTLIPDSLLEVLVPLLLGNMSNILTFSDLYRNMLFVSTHSIFCENKTYLSIPIVIVCVS